MTEKAKYDEIGYWSEIKLDIIKEYASAYSRIMSSQTSPQFYHLYIDAFAGPGKHISKSTGEFVPGSPENALLVEPPFHEYHFIDLDKQKIESLENMAGFQNVPEPIAMRNSQNAPQHTFQVLTKRVDRMAQFFKSNEVPGNAWIGTTVENKKHGAPRIDKLRRIKAYIRFLSIEPLLEELGIHLQ